MLGNSPIADLSTTQWQHVVTSAMCREFAVEQLIEKPNSFAIWLIESGGVCITCSQERHYYQQGQIIAVDGMIGEFSVSSNTRLLCLDGPALQSLSNTCQDTANILYRLASKQQFQSEVLEMIEQYCGPLRLAHRTEILAACQWQSVAPGDVLVNRGERCFHWHIVLHGKLCGMRRFLYQSDVDKKLNKTIKQQVDIYRLRGDCFGQTALLGNGEYQMSFVAKTAVRLVKFKRDIFDLLWQHYDNFKQIIATELAMSHAIPLHPEWGSKSAFAKVGEFEQSGSVINSLAEACDDDCQLIEFEKLALKLGLPLEVGRMVRHPGWYTIYRWWQDNLEHDMILGCDNRYPAWQSFCTANANRVIALLDARLDLAQVNSELLTPRFGIKRWLLICHQADVEQPNGTARWLRKFADPSFLHWRFNHQSDSARVMRTIQGRGTALVLKGCYRGAVAQIGVLKQLQNGGFEADMVIGDGFSLLLAAFYALGVNLDKIYQDLVVNTRKGLGGLRIGRMVSRNAIIFRRVFHHSFRQVSIEDMWLPYTCCGVNEQSQPLFFNRGKLRHAVKQLNIHAHQASTQGAVDFQDTSGSGLEQIEPFCHTKVVVVDVKPSVKPLTGNPLSRWFHKENGQFKGHFVSTIQALRTDNIEQDPSDDDKQEVIEWLMLQLHLPEYGVNNQNLLNRLITLGQQQAMPLLESLELQITSTDSASFESFESSALESQ